MHVQGSLLRHIGALHDVIPSAEEDAEIFATIQKDHTRPLLTLDI